MKDCVDFVYGYAYEVREARSGADPEGYGYAQYAVDIEDESRPLWWLVAINQRHVFFTFHHFIGASIARFYFHRSLLAALNSITGRTYKITQLILLAPAIFI